MTVVGKSWSRLTLPGKIVFTVVPLLLVTALVALWAILLLGPTILDILTANLPIVRFVVAVTIVLLMTVPTAFLIIYMEMKVIALMNLRIGPDRVGPFGSLLSVVHGLKVLMKEDFTPTGADPIVFTWAPVVTYLASVMTLLVIPFAPGLFGQDLNLGLLYFFAIGGLSVVGLLMAGWSSYNKYSLLGGLRSAAQVISYEIPLTLSVVGLILLAGTMSLNQIVLNQSGWFTDWYVFQQPLAVLIFFIAATAEANRTPFDLTEADSEIVAGFATEYSGMRFGFFFFAEYVNVFIISALTVTLFFGGWNAPFPWPWPITLSLDPGSLGILLLILVAVVPLILTLVFAAPVWMLSGRIKGWQALIVGFILANLFIVAVIFGAGLRRARLGRRHLLVPGQDLRLRVHVRLDARDPAARPHRPADGLRLEVAAAGVAAQPVRDRRGDRRGQDREALAMSLVPGLGIAKGMALTLRRFFEPKVTVMYPEDRRDVPHKFRGRLQLLYDEWGTLKCETCFQCAQACPIECIDMGGIDTRGRFHVHWGAPETYGERREESALRRSGRPVPDPAYLPFAPVDMTLLDRVLDEHDHDPARHAGHPRGDARGLRLPAGRRPQADQPADRSVVRDDLRHRDLLQPPALRARGGVRAGGRRRRAPTAGEQLPGRPGCRSGAGAPAVRQAGAGVARWSTCSRPPHPGPRSCSSAPVPPTRRTSTRRRGPARSTGCAAPSATSGRRPPPPRSPAHGCAGEAGQASRPRSSGGPPSRPMPRAGTS